MGSAARDIRLATGLAAAMFFGGCGTGVVVTPGPSASPVLSSATPSPTIPPTIAPPAATPEPTPSPTHGPGVTVTGCDWNTDPDCQLVRMAPNPVERGRRVRVRLTVTNAGAGDSPPLTISARVNQWQAPPGQDLPRNLRFVSCNGCTAAKALHDSTYLFEWPPLEAGETRDLIVTYRAIGEPACYGWLMVLYPEPAGERMAEAEPEVVLWDGIETLAYPGAIWDRELYTRIHEPGRRAPRCSELP